MPRRIRGPIALALVALLCHGTLGGDDGRTAAPAKSPDEIERLIRQLGSDDFGRREAASKALEAVGEPAREALGNAAGVGDDAEVRRRAEKVLEALDARLYRELRRFEGHAVSASEDKTVRLWRLSPDAGNSMSTTEGGTVPKRE